MSFFCHFSTGNFSNIIFEPSFLYTWLTARSVVPKRERCWTFFHSAETFAIISAGWNTTDVKQQQVAA